MDTLIIAFLRFPRKKKRRPNPPKTVTTRGADEEKTQAPAITQPTPRCSGYRLPVGRDFLMFFFREL